MLVAKCVYAETIAQLLREFDIDCVVLSACKSAAADAGLSANLSCIFLEKGISAVLAMSHNMHDSVSKRFYPKFYSEFIAHYASITTAASEARRVLFHDRARRSYQQEAEVYIQDWFIPVVYASSENPLTLSNDPRTATTVYFGIIPIWETILSLASSILIFLCLTRSFCDWSWIESRLQSCPKQSDSISKTLRAVFSSIPIQVTGVRTIRRACSYWRVRQRLRFQVLAEDRQNILRIEGDMMKRKMVFIYSKESEDEDARPFLDCLADIWERTHFVIFGGVIDAEWFVQPGDLFIGQSWQPCTTDWSLWAKSIANVICLWVYDLRRHHFSFMQDTKSVIIVHNLDLLYPEAEIFKNSQYYAGAQRRLEDWFRENFKTQRRTVSPYLVLASFRRESLGGNVSK